MSTRFLGRAIKGERGASRAVGISRVVAAEKKIVSSFASSAPVWLALLPLDGVRGDTDDATTMGRLELPRFDAATANSSRSRLPPRFLLAGLAILTLLGLKLNYHHPSTPPAPPRVNPLRKPTTRIAANTTDYDLQGWFEASRQPGAMQEATLEERLQDWESAPIGELGNWVKFNALNCPKRLEENRNESQLKKAHMLWSSLTSDDIARLRGEMIEVLREAEAEGLMGEKHWGKGRGLVFTAGNAVRCFHPSASSSR